VFDQSLVLEHKADLQEIPPVSVVDAERSTLQIEGTSWLELGRIQERPSRRQEYGRCQQTLELLGG
jgi:hypothetical protein